MRIPLHRPCKTEFFDTVSYCMYLMDLMNRLEDFDNNYYTAMEMALETYAFREEGLYELAQAHHNAGNYDIAGCWLIEKE